MAYTDTTQVGNFLQRSLTAYETSELTNIIAAIKVWLDKRLNTTFDSVVASTRYYDGGVRNLDIDPCTAITKVEAINDDGTDSYEYTSPTEYIAEPQNEAVKRELRKRLARFPRGVHRIAVSASFSEYDSGVPADIQIAATRLAAGVINAGKYASQGGNIHMEDLEGHRIQYQLNAATLNGLADGDPTIAAILAVREELYIDNYEPRNEFGYSEVDDGGLLL